MGFHHSPEPYPAYAQGTQSALLPFSDELRLCNVKHGAYASLMHPKHDAIIAKYRPATPGSLPREQCSAVQSILGVDLDVGVLLGSVYLCKLCPFGLH
eukprot:1157722-Pelagomonas_calceolata.AAC.10